MTKELAFLDYAVIAAFFAVMIGVGVYYSRKSKSSDQFFGNDKTVPWWLSGVSFYMNSFSALAFVMYSALAYKFGWVPDGSPMFPLAFAMRIALFTAMHNQRGVWSSRFRDR